MKINYNCVRDLLFALEKNIVMNEELTYPYLNFNDVIAHMNGYSKADIAYTTIMSKEAGLIDAEIIDADDSFQDCFYFGLTYNGHQFLDTVKSQNIWNKTKNVASKIGSFALPMLQQIAVSVAESAIKSILNSSEMQ